jgi:hypothetical protein
MRYIVLSLYSKFQFSRCRKKLNRQTDGRALKIANFSILCLLCINNMIWEVFFSVYHAQLSLPLFQFSWYMLKILLPESFRPIWCTHNLKFEIFRVPHIQDFTKTGGLMKVLFKESRRRKNLATVLSSNSSSRVQEQNCPGSLRILKFGNLLPHSNSYRVHICQPAIC